MKSSRVVTAVAALAIVASSALLLASPAWAVANVPDLTPTGGATTNQSPVIQGFYDNTAGNDITLQVTVTTGTLTSNYCTDSIDYFESTAAEPWSCSGAPLPYGTHTFSSFAFETSAPGVFSGNSITTDFTIGGTQPIVISTPAPAAVFTDSTPTVTGTGPSLGTVDVTMVTPGAMTLCSANVDVAGNWSCEMVPLSPNNYTFDAVGLHVDGAAATSAPAQALTILPPDPPTVDQTFTPWISGSEYPSVQGTMGSAGIDEVEVFYTNGGGPETHFCTVTTDPLATVWYCLNPASPLPLGINSVYGYARSEAGITSLAGPAATIEVVQLPVASGPADGLVTSNNQPVFSGTTVTTGTFTAYSSAAAPTAMCSGPVVAGAFSCSPAGPLPDGTYPWFVYMSPGDGVSTVTRTITIDTVAPPVPVITQPGMTTTDRQPVLRGTAEPGASIEIYRDGSLAGCAEGAVSADSSGQWRCTSPITLAVGATYGFGAAQTDAAGNRSSAGTPPVTLSLTILAVPEPVVTPAPPLAWTFSFGVSGTEFAAGDKVEVSASGLPPGSSAAVEFHSTPVNVGSTVVGPDGSFSLMVVIPPDAEPGQHRFVVTVTPLDGLPSVQEQPITVRPRAVVEPTQELPQSDVVGNPRDDPAAPSSFTNALTTAQSIFSNPAFIGAAAVAGLALLLLVAFPAELLNSTIAEQYDRFAGRLPAVRAPWWRRFRSWLHKRPLVGGTLMTIAAAIIFGFADPGFGFDVTSLRLVLACTLALLVVGYLASAISGTIIRRRWALETVMELKPLGLILTVVGVVLSRLLDFSPGFLLGLILGIAVVGNTTAAQRAKVTLVRMGVVFSLALVAWFAYSLLSATIAPDSFGAALTFDTLVAVTAEGLTALFVGLLPLRYLDGQALFQHSRLLWAACYTCAAFAFLLIVVPASWGDLGGSLGLWLAIVGGFAVVSVGIYLYFRFWAPPLEEDGEEQQDDDADVTLRNRT